MLFFLFCFRNKSYWQLCRNSQSCIPTDSCQNKNYCIGNLLMQQPEYLLVKNKKIFFLSTNEKLELNYQAWRIIPVYILICRQRNNTFNDSKYRFWIIHLIRILWNTKKLEFFYYRTIFLFWEINPIFFLYTKQELWTRSNQDLPTAVYRQQTQTIRIPHLNLILWLISLKKCIFYKINYFLFIK